jgi:hypothetical protein
LKLSLNQDKFRKIRNNLTQNRASAKRPTMVTSNPSKPTPNAIGEAPAVRVITDLGALGQHLRLHRKRQGLRIDDAAALQGISVDLLSRLENGKGSVRTDKLLAVLEGLGLAVVIAPKDHSWLRTLPEGDTPDQREAL